MSFNPKDHMSNLKGKDYLEVKWRLVWFRDDHPSGQISTELLQINELAAIVRAVIMTADGVVLGTGLGMATASQATMGRYVEKAETAAIGRALAHAGYGTQFAGEDLEEDDHLSDSPVEPRRPASLPPTPKAAAPVHESEVKQPAFRFPPTIRLAELDGGQLLDFQKTGAKALGLSFEDFRALAHDALDVEHLKACPLTIKDAWARIVSRLPDWATDRAKATVAAQSLPSPERIIPLADADAPRTLVDASERLRKQGYRITAGELRTLAQDDGLVEEGEDFPLQSRGNWDKLQAAVKKTLAPQKGTQTSESEAA